MSIFSFWPISLFWLSSASPFIRVLKASKGNSVARWYIDSSQWVYMKYTLYRSEKSIRYFNRQLAPWCGITCNLTTLNVVYENSCSLIFFTRVKIGKILRCLTARLRHCATVPPALRGEEWVIIIFSYFKLPRVRLSGSKRVKSNEHSSMKKYEVLISMERRVTLRSARADARSTSNSGLEGTILWTTFYGQHFMNKNQDCEYS